MGGLRRRRREGEQCMGLGCMGPKKGVWVQDRGKIILG